MKILIFTISILFSSFFYAQNINKIGVDFGVSRTGIDNFLDGGFGFHAGGFYEIKISDKFILRPNIGIALQGDRRPKGDETTPLSRINYIASPVDLIFQLNKKNRVFGGVQYAVLLSSDLPVKSNEFGFNLGYERDLDNKVFYNFRFYNSFSSINNNDEINQWLQIGIGYYIN